MNESPPDSFFDSPSPRPEVSEHQTKITKWILDALEHSAGKRLLVLGPAVANHLDLFQLIEKGIDVELIDLDAGLLEQGLAAQQVELPESSLHVIEDIAGIKAQCLELTQIREERTPGFHDSQLAIDAARDFVGWALEGPFDVVVSIETLGALGGICHVALGEAHPSLPEWHRTVRQRHLWEMIRLLQPQGFGMVINAIISTAHMPSLPQVPDHALEALLTEVIQLHPVPANADPRVVMNALEFEAPHRDHIAGAALLPPWRTVFGGKQFAFSGISFQTKMPIEEESV